MVPLCCRKPATKGRRLLCAAADASSLLVHLQRQPRGKRLPSPGTAILPGLFFGGSRSPRLDFPNIGLIFAELVVQRLGELGWVAGRNVVVEYRYAEGSLDRAGETAAEFARMRRIIGKEAPRPAASS